MSFHAAESLNALRAAAEDASRYAPLAVSFNGRDLERRDSLKGAIRTERWEGITLAVIESSCLPHNCWDLNFHGLPLHVRLPYVDALNGKIWTVCAEAVDCPELELVLPARTQAVENAFLARLRAQATGASEANLPYALAPMPDASAAAAVAPPSRITRGPAAPPAPSSCRNRPLELRPWAPPGRRKADDDVPIGRAAEPPVDLPDALVVDRRRPTQRRPAGLPIPSIEPPAAPISRASGCSRPKPGGWPGTRDLFWYDRLPRLTGVGDRACPCRNRSRVHPGGARRSASVTPETTAPPSTSPCTIGSSASS